MNNKAQMITIFFSLFLILAIITILGIESANLNTNENVNSLIQAYNLPKLEYYNFLNVMSKISTINPSNATAAVFNSTIEGIYSKFFQNINITNQGVNTSSLVISNFAESIPLLITNYQNIATPNPFQQMINISVSSIDNYVNTTSFGQNVEFVYDNNSVIPSWLESYNSKYAIWWIKIPSIPAKGTITIYMKFANKKTNLFNNKTTGEAPQLSPTYAEYDDGADVFNFYDNFAGTTLNTNKWSVSSGLTYSVDNGISLTGSSQCGSGLESTVTFSSPIIVEAYGRMSSDTSTATGCYISGIGIWYTSGGQITNGWATDSVQKFGINGWTGSSSFWSSEDNPQPNAGNSYIWGLSYVSSSSALGNINYQEVSSTSTTISTSGSLTAIIDLQDDNVFDIDLTWYRVRAYPPNGVMPTVQILNAPANIGYIAPLTITNHQNVATPNPFQQEVVINASRYSALEAPNLDNIEFFYSNGTIIPSWLESGNSSSENATYWLKVGSIPANSSINAYIGFASTNLNLFNGKTVGEAPQLSPNYAEYDDGADVFNVYSNFAGTSLPSDFTSYVGDATLSVDNGLHLQVANNGCSSTWAGIIYNNPIDSADSIVETYSSGTRPNGPEDVGIYTGNSDTAGGYAGVADTWGWGYGTISGGYGNIGNPFDISSGSGVASIYWIGNGNEGIGWNYNFVSSTNTNEGWSSSLYASIQTGECSPNANMVYYWFRVRAYPPNGVMPSTSIGDIQDIYPFEYQYSVANFTNSTSISVPGTASTGKIWNGGHAYTLAMWVKMDHAYGTCGYPCSDLFQTNQGCTSGLEQDPYNATGYQVNLLEWNSSCGTGATAQGSPYQYVPYGKWELITGIFKYNSQGNAWIASCVDTSCTNRTWTLTAPAVYSTPATILGSNQMNGQVADVQMYDSALTLNQVNQLYNEFIGAQPVYNSTLVAWIPLDGNAYDDSGNGNTASLTSVNFLYP